MSLRDIADIELTGGRYKILHSAGRRIQTVTAGAVGRDIQDFESDARSRIGKEVKLAPGNYAVFTGTARAQAQASEDLVVHSVIAGIGIFLLLYIAFNNLRNLLITFLNLPFALIGGIIAVLRDRRLAVARLSGRLRHPVRHHAAQFDHAGVALPAPGGG